MPLITWLVFIFFSGISNAIAEETEADERFGPHLELDEMVITGTRTEKKLLETPVRTEVVTREEIEQSHARDLKEALEDVPGLILRRTHGKQGESVGMQGFDADRILILLNGERLSATAGSTVDLTQIGTADIERIEIVKGATSALYGSEAMGGVINVITRKPKKPFSLTPLLF
ncbi:MAG: TonB-dependent receptor [Nitrospirae bacterium]|nr:TonB-dependent receptor [Candidatus Manganitrophaceae bacterium]